MQVLNFNNVYEFNLDFGSHIYHQHIYPFQLRMLFHSVAECCICVCFMLNFVLGYLYCDFFFVTALGYP